MVHYRSSTWSNPRSSPRSCPQLSPRSSPRSCPWFSPRSIIGPVHSPVHGPVHGLVHGQVHGPVHGPVHLVQLVQLVQLDLGWAPLSGGDPKLVLMKAECLILLSINHKPSPQQFIAPVTQSFVSDADVFMSLPHLLQWVPPITRPHSYCLNLRTKWCK